MFKNKILILVFGLALLFGASYFLEKKEPPDDLSLTKDVTSEAALLEEAFQNEPENKAAPSSVKIPIFVYHSVRPHIAGESKIQDRYDITPELLEKQLIYMNDNGYRTITLDELVRDVENGTTTPVAKPVILTFDDGWRNQYQYAFPLLKKYRATATFYIYTNHIGKRKHSLTWEEVKEMDAAGMTIGSHTITHPFLKNLSHDEIKKEIFDSKKILEKELGKPVVHFASPFGDTSPEIVNLIREAGYETGRTIYKGIYHNKEDLFKLRGVLVSDDFNDFVKILKR